MSIADRQTHNYSRRTSGKKSSSSFFLLYENHRMDRRLTSLSRLFFNSMTFDWLVNEIQLKNKFVSSFIHSSLSLFFIHWTLQFVLHFIKLFKVNVYIHIHRRIDKRRADPKGYNPAVFYSLDLRSSSHKSVVPA